MNARTKLNHQRTRRGIRSRARIVGTAERPRLSIFRSNKGVSVQLINDALHRTIASASFTEVKGAKTKTDQAMKVGTLIAERAKAAKVGHAVVDRGEYRYHGRVRALVEAARAGGLEI